MEQATQSWTPLYDQKRKISEKCAEKVPIKFRASFPFIEIINYNESYLKGTVARDFMHLSFFINQHHMDPRVTH
jgi:hypothetical protein